MSGFEQKELTGALFVNENKEHDRQPDYTGNVRIDGKDWRLAGWLTTSRGNVDYISIKVTDPEEFRRQRDGGQTTEKRGFPGQKPAQQGSSHFDRERERIKDIANKARESFQPRRSLPDDIDEDDIPF